MIHFFTIFSTIHKGVLICADPTGLCCMFSVMNGLKPVPIKCIEPTALYLRTPYENDIDSCN